MTTTLWIILGVVVWIILLVFAGILTQMNSRSDTPERRRKERDWWD